MANIDEKAFNQMNQADPDWDITGGAVDYSKFEMDMSPKEQEAFLRDNAELFRSLYNTDPNVDPRKLSYKSYLENLDPKLILLRAREYEENVRKKAPLNPDIITSGQIASQAEQHWGGETGVTALRDMVLGDPSAWEEREPPGL